MPRKPPVHRPPGHRTDGQRKSEHDARRKKDQRWRAWYKLAVWLERRADQLRREPLCRMCRKKGRITAATIADHVIPHKGDWVLFIAGELQSLCTNCHNSEKQSEERQAG